LNVVVDDDAGKWPIAAAPTQTHVKAFLKKNSASAAERKNKGAAVAGRC
jgi:hypothetical protein